MFFSFIAYVVQSCFSINQIGIAIWGWLFGGLVVGTSHAHLQTPQIMSIAVGDHRSSKNKVENSNIPKLVVFFLSIAIGFFIALSPFLKDIEFRRSILNGDGISLEMNLERFPRNSEYYVVAERAFLLSDLKDEALRISNRAVKFNPKDFDSWKLIFENPESSQNLKNFAKLQMNNIDPFYVVEP